MYCVSVGGQFKSLIQIEEKQELITDLHNASIPHDAYLFKWEHKQVSYK